MKTYHFETVVERDGSVRLSGLPPSQQVEVVVLERSGELGELQEWLRDVRQRHPFATMSKDEILESLRQTRAAVWTERHAS